MQTEPDLQRFLTAQEKVYPVALEEIRNGRKRTHWMWYIFPQVRGLGSSSYSTFYGIADLKEAEAFLNHPILGKRIQEIAMALLDQETNDARAIFGSPDDLKLRSSMTLFSSLSQAPPVFQKVLEKFFDGAKDQRTLELQR